MKYKNCVHLFFTNILSASYIDDMTFTELGSAKIIRLSNDMMIMMIKCNQWNYQFLIINDSRRTAIQGNTETSAGVFLSMRCQSCIIISAIIIIIIIIILINMATIHIIIISVEIIWRSLLRLSSTVRIDYHQSCFLQNRENPENILNSSFSPWLVCSEWMHLG